ncbi:MAG TPA: hypothetical protein VIQ00_13665, partial [Chitinophagaceae bacterium]
LKKRYSLFLKECKNKRKRLRAKLLKNLFQKRIFDRVSRPMIKKAESHSQYIIQSLHQFQYMDLGNSISENLFFSKYLLYYFCSNQKMNVYK